MKELTNSFLNAAQMAKCRTAISRHRSADREHRREKRLAGGYVQDLRRSFGVRVLHKGCWGFASSRERNPEEVARVTKLAVEIAEASSTLKKKDTWLVDEPRTRTFTSRQ